MRILFFLLTLVLCISCGESKTDQEYVLAAKEYLSTPDSASAILELKNALRLNPDNEEARVLLADIYFGQYEYSAAIDYTTRIPESSPFRAQAEAIQAKSLAYQQRFEELESIEYREYSGVYGAETLAAQSLARLWENDSAQAGILLDEAESLGADSEFVTFTRAKFLELNSDNESAKRELTNLIDKNPNNSQAWLRLGMIEEEIGNRESALDAYNTAVELAPSLFAAHFRRALIVVLSEDYESAAEDIKFLRKNGGDPNPLAAYLEGINYFRSGQLELAAPAFDEALLMDNRFPLALLLGAASNYALGNKGRAENQLNRFSSISPNNIAARQLLARIYLDQGKSEQAIELLDPVYKSPANDEKTVNLLASAYSALGNQDEVMELFEESVEFAPDSNPTRLRRAVGYLKEGDLELAESAIQKVITVDPGYEKAGVVQVISYYNQGQIDEALDSLEAFEERDTKSHTPSNLRGWLSLKLNDPAAARAAFLEALEKSPGDPYASNKMAVLALQQKDFGTAKKYYAEAIKQYPDNSALKTRLALVEWEEGNTDSAINQIQEVVAQHPDSFRPRVLLAAFYNNSGQPAMVPGVFQSDSGKWDNHPQVLYMTSISQIARAEYASAVATLKKLAKSSPDSLSVNSLLAVAYAGNNDKEGLRQVLDKRLESRPDDPNTRIASARLYLLERNLPALKHELDSIPQEYRSQPEFLYITGLYYRATGDQNTALTYLNSAFEAQPIAKHVIASADQMWVTNHKSDSLKLLKDWLNNNPSDNKSRLRFAHFLKISGEEALALEQYRYVIKQDPASTEALNSAAWLLKESDPKKALELANQALAIQPRLPMVLDTAAMVALELEDYTRSEEYLKDALSISPNDLTLQYHLAVIHVAQENYAEAEPILSRLLQEGNNFSDRAEAESLLKSIPGN